MTVPPEEADRSTSSGVGKGKVLTLYPLTSA